MRLNTHQRPWLEMRLAAAVLLGFLVTGTGGSARAASAEFCEKYTADAVADQRRNLDMKCGFTGPPWSSDRAGHHPWCLGAREESANQQRDDRRYWLGRCQRCSDYADRAMAAISKAAKLCNFSGARWDPSRAGHVTWCMEAKDEHVNREDRDRTYDADKCVRCTDYAEEARRAQEENRVRGCGFIGPDWNPDRGAHFSWCWNLEPAYQGAPASHSATRRTMLGYCPDAAKRKKCESYAERAISQYETMRKLANCSQSGVKWHANRSDHYNWCIAVPAAESAAHDRERDAKLAACGRGKTAPPPSGEQCLFSVVVTNKKCINDDGSPMSTRPEGTMTNTGCGDTPDKALVQALKVMSEYQCLTPGNTPAPNCCTYGTTTSQGCLCGTPIRTQERRPHADELRNESGTLNRARKLPVP